MSYGAIVQLNTTGVQDAILTGHPQFSYFQKEHKRHTNFAIEGSFIYLNEVSPGSKHVVEIPRHGDLIHNIYLFLETSDILSKHAVYNKDPTKNTKLAWVKKLGHAVIENIMIMIGGSPIDKQFGTWMDVWYELTKDINKEKGYNELIGNIPELTNMKSAQSSITDDIIIESKNLFIPLQFWFCKHIHLSLPIVALQYHKVTIEIEFAKIEKLILWSGEKQPSLSDIRFKETGFLIDFIYLTKQEREMLAQKQHNFLIEKLQFPHNIKLTSDGSHDLISKSFDISGINHPTKELIWVAKVGAFNGENNKRRSKFLCYTDNNNWDNAINYAANSIVTNSIIVTKNDFLKLGTWVNIKLDADIVENSVGNASYIDENNTEWEFVIKNNGGHTIKKNVRQFIKINSESLVKDGISLNKFIKYVNIYIKVTEVNEDDGTIEKIMMNNIEHVINDENLIEFDDNSILTIKHELNLIDLSIPIEDFTDTRVHKLFPGSTHNRRDVSVIQFDNYGLSLDGTGNILNNSKMSIGGYDRFREHTFKYFNSLQPYRHHSRTPKDGINVYSFCLNPEDDQPSGAANFSRFENILLHNNYNDSLRKNRNIKLNFTRDSSIFIYGLSYNILRIMGGVGALAFGN